MNLPHDPSRPRTQGESSPSPAEGLLPPAAQQPYRLTLDLLQWIGSQFDLLGDTYRAEVFGTPCHVTRDVDHAYHVLVENWQNYVKGEIIERVAFLLGNGLMVSEGELWKNQRRMIQPAFTHESSHALAGLIALVNTSLLERWKAAAALGETVNVTRDVSAMALEVVLRFILGADYQRIGSHFQLLSEEQTRSMAFAQSFRALGEVIIQLIEERRKTPAPRSDALAMLMDARDPQTGQPMSDRQIVDEVLTLIVAGHETTASTLAWTWYLLSQNPEAEETLSEELLGWSGTLNFDQLPNLPYSRQVIEEAMRLYPAGWLITRKAIREDRIGDFLVPAGTEIYLPLYFIQRHPGLWPEPGRFLPERFRAEALKQRHRLASMPFSAGPRNCIGVHFARLEMQIHLLIIAKELRLRYAESAPVELDAGVNLRSRHDFRMLPELKKVPN